MLVISATPYKRIIINYAVGKTLVLDRVCTSPIRVAIKECDFLVINVPAIDQLRLTFLTSNELQFVFKISVDYGTEMEKEKEL
jgi:hypothetical protein